MSMKAGRRTLLETFARISAVVFSVATSVVFVATANASGIFTLKGKLKSFTEDTYVVQTRTMIYDIQKSGLTDSQQAEMKTKKTGQDVDLVVTTDAILKVRDL